MFRRRRGRHRSDPVGDTHVGDAAETEPDDAMVPEDRPNGPWDVSEPAPEMDRVDLGALRVPKGPDLEVRADLAGDQIFAATVVQGSNALQVLALAAPKKAGIWHAVRRDIVAELEETGGGAGEVEGVFGTELRARVPAQAQDGKAVLRPARFVGVDGPRWLLRGVFTGPAAEHPASAVRLEEVFRAIIVVRGDAAFPPRELLELQYPPEMRETEDEDEDDGQPELNRFRRGPEITETR